MRDEMREVSLIESFNFIKICFQFNNSYTMVKYCCICKDKWTTEKDISFFSFPKSEDMLKEWLRVIPTVKEYRSHLRVCNAHFHESEYRRVSNKLILNKNAIPSISPQSVDITSPDNSTVENTDSTSVFRNESTSSSLSPEIIDTEDLSCTPLEKERKKEEGVQASPDVKNVETQISLRRLQPSIRERELIHENQSLKKKLRRRDIKLLNLTSVLKRLKSEEKRKKEEEVQASPDVKNVATQISFTTTPTKYSGMKIIACKSNSKEEIVYRRDIEFTQT